MRLLVAFSIITLGLVFLFAWQFKIDWLIWIACPFIIILVLLAIFYKCWKFIAINKYKELEQKENLTLRLNSVKFFFQILGGTFFIVSLFLTYRSIVISQEKHITDLYVKAIANLQSSEGLSRLGWIYALERISKDSAKDYWSVMAILTAYVREKVAWKEELAVNTPGTENGLKEGAPKTVVRPHPAIQAILTIIGCRSEKQRCLEKQRLDLRHTNLQGAELERSFFNRILLNRANLANSNLNGAQFQEGDLTEGCLKNSQLIKSILSKAILHKANLDGANLSDATLTGADLSEASLEGAILVGTILNGTVLSKTNLRKSNLWKANLNRAVLYMAFLQEAQLHQANLEGALLEGAHLEDADLWQANLQDANLREAHLENTKLWEANLKGVNFDNANLRYAIFSKTHLEGADLSKAIGITRDQLNNAIIDNTTRLPDYLK